MDKQRWYDERDNRTLRYAARRLDHGRWISMTASAEYLATYDGQVAALVACNLLGRMTPSIGLDFADIRVHPALPWAGQSLQAVLLRQMRSADPFGSFAIRASVPADFRLHVGPAGEGVKVHGVGWNAWVGTEASPLEPSDDLNGFGAALAVIAAASQIFLHAFSVPEMAFAANAFDWRGEHIDGAPAYRHRSNVGNIWTLGAGSVGTAALYFLSLATSRFRATVIDMDLVKIHNLDRSPIFNACDLGLPKVECVKAYLSTLGIGDVRVDDKPLNESALWNGRNAGEVDLIIAAANERKARYYIEAGFPPLQLYATTGQNWQTTLIRHEPDAQRCSLCLFPNDQKAADTACATAPQSTSTGEQIDAALPFLSFAAGLMTAAETMKLGIPGYPFSANRVILNTRPGLSLVAAPLRHRPGCFCETRDRDVHAKMIAGSKYLRQE
jgi:molybdopterin/thiamine biosynthesis adenylyltransferase